MKYALIACLVLPLAGCITVHESTPGRREVRIEKEVVIEAAAAPAIHVRAVRMPATDVPGMAEFYKKAFGMHEIRRIGGGAFLEIVLNTGADVEEATANPKAPVVLMTRPEQMGETPPLAYLLFNVPDMAAAIAAVEDAGGKVMRPTTTTSTGTTYAFVTDPEGNQVELLLAR